MKDTELNDLFSDKKLEPSKSFEKQLFKTIQPVQQRNGRSIFAKAGAVFAVTLVLIGFTVFRPASDTLGKTVFLKDLYAGAFAEELPGDSSNFWKIAATTTYGSQAPLCTNTPAGTSTEKVTLLYNNGEESAIYEEITGDEPYMRLSTDKDIPAYDDAVFDGTSSSEVRQYLVNTTITDEAGNALPLDAKTEQKNEGTYTIYVSSTTPQDDVKNYTEGCETLRIKIDVDVVSGLYTSVGIYNATESNDLVSNSLSFVSTRSIEAGSYETFESVSERFIAEGFDTEKARSESLLYNNVNVTNKEAGYAFSYNKLLLGTPVLKTKINDSGEITVYEYSFTKQPEVLYTIHTSKSVDMIDLEDRASKENLTIITDSGSDSIVLPGYGEVQQKFFTARSETTKFGRTDTGSTDIPVVYVEAPVGLGEYEKIDKYAPDFPSQVDDVLSLLSVQVFPPNTEPPVGL